MALPRVTLPVLAGGRRPVAKYYLYRASLSASFTVPIFVRLFRSRGLSFAAIGLVEAVYTVVVLGSEVPTGYVGDRVGRRASMLDRSPVLDLKTAMTDDGPG